MSSSRSRDDASSGTIGPMLVVSMTACVPDNMPDLKSIFPFKISNITHILGASRPDGMPVCLPVYELKRTHATCARAPTCHSGSDAASPPISEERPALGAHGNWLLEPDVVAHVTIRIGHGTAVVVAIGATPDASATTPLRSTPIGAMSISIVSPTWIGPTPAGVPVMMTSPGSSVRWRLR